MARGVWLLPAVLLGGCLQASPETEGSQLGPDCVGTEEGKACLSMHFAFEQSTFEASKGDLKGDLHWALFKEGDVGFFGPGENMQLYGDHDFNVDMSKMGATHTIHVANVEPRAYQAVGWFDDDLDGTDNEGDPVTLPSEPFNVPADEHTTVFLFFNWVL